jgi:aquaporin Z
MVPKKFLHRTECKVLAEFVGTYYLVFVVGCNVLTNSIGAALSIGGMLMVMIYALGSVSGAHFNPAVTIAIFGSQRGLLSFTDACLYMLGQIGGGFCAALSYWFLFGQTFTIAPVGQYSLMSAIIVEILYTMALCYVVLNVTTTRKQDGSNYFGLAIGFTIVSAALTIGGISGCVLNPAVALGCSLVAAMHDGSAAFLYTAVYFCIPFVGALLADGAFYIVQKRDEYNWVVM